MTSLYEISYYGIEQRITLAPAWRCLFTVRNYMTLFNTIAFMGAVGVVVWLSLGMAKVPSSRRRQYSVASVIFKVCRQSRKTFLFLFCFLLFFLLLYFLIFLYLLLSLFCTFCSLFHTMANISNFLSHWHSHVNFYFQLANLCVVANWRLKCM